MNRIEVGYSLESVVKRPTLEQSRLNASRYKGEFWETSIHTNEAEARKVGFTKPLFEGMFLINYIFQIMSNAFREAWFRQGELSIALLSPVFPGESVTAKGVVIEKVQDDEGITVILDVWLENDRTDKILAGKAVVRLEPDQM